LYDTDGRCHKQSSEVEVKSKASRLVEDLERFLKSRQISYRKYFPKKGLQSIVVARTGIRAFATTVGFLCPPKQQALIQLLSRGPSFLEFIGSNLTTVTTTGHFDFRLLPKLLVVDAYEFLQGGYSQNRILKPTISSKTRKKWARSGRVPFKVMEKLSATKG
jgi:hypothetical protein